MSKCRNSLEKLRFILKKGQNFCILKKGANFFDLKSSRNPSRCFKSGTNQCMIDSFTVVICLTIDINTFTTGSSRNK